MEERKKIVSKAFEQRLILKILIVTLSDRDPESSPSLISSS